METEKEAPAAVEPSPEELALVRLLAQGFTDDVVARRLNLAKRTYRRRLDSAWAKLGARSRFQAGVIAAQRGWIPEPIADDNDDSFWPPLTEGAIPGHGEPGTTHTTHTNSQGEKT